MFSYRFMVGLELSAAVIQCLRQTCNCTVACKVFFPNTLKESFFFTSEVWLKSYKYRLSSVYQTGQITTLLWQGVTDESPSPPTISSSCHFTAFYCDYKLALSSLPQTWRWEDGTVFNIKTSWSSSLIERGLLFLRNKLIWDRWK